MQYCIDMNKSKTTLIDLKDIFEYFINAFKYGCVICRANLIA